MHENEPFIAGDGGISIAANLPRAELEKLLGAAGRVEGVKSVTLGPRVLGRLSLYDAVELIKECTPGANICYDHQRAGMGGDDTAERFADFLEEGGVKAAVVFPWAGYDADKSWIKALQVRGISPIIGLEPISGRYLKSEGGYVPDRALRRVVSSAIQQGVVNFRLRARRPWSTVAHRDLMDERIGRGKYTLMVADLETMATIKEVRSALGDGWHAVIGKLIEREKTPKAIEAKTRAIARTLLKA